MSRFRTFRDKGANARLFLHMLSVVTSDGRGVRQVDYLLFWLDAACNDDRMLAGRVKDVRSHFGSVVTVVTGHINLENKVEFVPFIEPSDVTVEDAATEAR